MTGGDRPVTGNAWRGVLTRAAVGPIVLALIFALALQTQARTAGPPPASPEFPAASTVQAPAPPKGPELLAPDTAKPAVTPGERSTPPGPVRPTPNTKAAPPDDPRLAQVHAVLDTYCAQCHQTGKLTRAAPGGGFANILDLDELAREPHLISRGSPDASRLYQVLLDRHRPQDLSGDAKWPGADEIQRVRTWIEETATAAPACADQPIQTPALTAAAIDAAVRAAGEAEARELRFVTLAPLAQACATPAELDGYRQGTAKLLNSLSWGSRPVALTAVGDTGTLLSFKLSDLGWIDEHWSALARAEPKGIALDVSGLVTAPGANGRPVRADWLAWSASQPAFYAELLGLPPTLDETAHLLGIRRDEHGAGKSIRAAVRTSALTRGPRVVERHFADTRRLWLAYDFLDGAGDRDVFERPLGGVRGALERAQFRADGQRMIFTLPNGFLGFGLLDADGRRIDRLPQRLEVEQARNMGPTVAGLACLGCHTAGLKPVTDAMRSHLTSDKFGGTRETKDQALAIYETANELARVFDDDAYRFRRALIQAGVDPDLMLHGLEPVSALARRYVVPVGLGAVAAEAGLTPAALDAKLPGLAVEDRSLISRLRQGLLTRAEANTLLAAMKPATADDDSGLAGAPLPEAPAMKLAVWTDRATYKPGDLMTVHARPSAPCHLTLISVNGGGKATVLFPNEFEPDNLVTPEAGLILPGEKSQYQFRLKDAGAETIVATCQTLAKFPAGIEPDYERQRFTVLGNFENFVRTSYGLDAAQQPAIRPEPQRSLKNAPKDAKPEPIKSEQSARAAIRVVIE